MDKREEFIRNETKTRLMQGLNFEVMAHITDREVYMEENRQTLEFLNKNPEHIETLLNQIIENAKLQCEMVGLIKGPKEVLSYIEPGKARKDAVDYWNAHK